MGMSESSENRMRDAFEAHYKADWNDPAVDGLRSVWLAAWEAASLPDVDVGDAAGDALRDAGWVAEADEDGRIKIIDEDDGSYIVSLPMGVDAETIQSVHQFGQRMSSQGYEFGRASIAEGIRALIGAAPVRVPPR